MKNDPNQNEFSSALLAGLLAGIFATLVCFVFDIYYRMATGYSPSEFINVSSIIFTVNLLMLLLGILFFVCKNYLKKGALIFTLSILVLTAFCVWKALVFHRFSDSVLSNEFSQLLAGSLLIIGLFAMGIPSVMKNKKISEFFI